MSEKGQLLGIAIRSVNHGPMNEVQTVEITTESGVGTDVRGRPGRRQATVITHESWMAACDELGSIELPWTSRRANLLVNGLQLRGKIGYDLKIGDAVLTISGETRPCQVMNQAYPGLMVALRPEWRGGVTCRVTKSGTAAVGCEVSLSRKPIRQMAWVTSHHLRRFLKQGRLRLAYLAGRLGLKEGKRERQPEH